MCTQINETSTAVGYVHTFVFEGALPSLEALLPFLNDVAPAPSNFVEHRCFKNRLSDYSVASSARLWVGEYVPTPSHIKLGTGAPPVGQDGPLTSDTDCWTPDATTGRACDVKTTFLTIYSEFGVTYDQTEVNDTTYTEALLYDDDGNAWAHAVIDFTKTSTQTGAILWKIAHQGN